MGRGNVPVNRGSLLPALAAVLLAVPLAFAMPPRACGDTVIAVTPTRIPLELAPGETATEEITLINQGTEEARLLPSIAILVEGEGGELGLEQGEACAWLEPGTDELLLAPGESGFFTFSIAVPQNARSGLYDLAISFELSRDGGEGIGLTGGIAVLVDLEVLPEPGGDEAGFSAGFIIIMAMVAAALLGAIVLAASSRHGTGKGSAGKGAKGEGE